MEDYYIRNVLERPFRDLKMVFCGKETCRPLHSWGPVVRPTYIIHYILKGKGIFKTDNETWHLHEKEGFLIMPKTQTFYQADQEDPWTYCWIGFEGDMAPLLLRELGLNEDRPVFCCDKKDELEKVFKTIFENLNASKEDDLILESQLYMFFAILMKNLQINDSRQKRSNDYIRSAIRFIRTHYQSPIRVSDIADHVGINRSYLYTLFLKETGMSPSEYLTSFRLNIAAEMLSLTTSPVEQIAYSCGYQDAIVFSKAFKNKYHISPTLFRKREEEKLK